MPYILELYDHYQILPNLREHQFRVAGVAAGLLRLLQIGGEERLDVLKAALLHDMGNILKFNLTPPNIFIADNELPKWQRVKQEFSDRYGNNVHEATQKIANEIGVNEHVLTLIRAVDFHLLEENTHGAPLLFTLMQYADMRVAPHSVTSLQERFEDGRRRYAKRNATGAFSAHMQTEIEDSWLLLQEMEQQIFARIPGHFPHDITEQSAQSYRTELEGLSFP